jgi:hypothetical protein
VIFQGPAKTAWPMQFWAHFNHLSFPLTLRHCPESTGLTPPYGYSYYMLSRPRLEACARFSSLRLEPGVSTLLAAAVFLNIECSIAHSSVYIKVVDLSSFCLFSSFSLLSHPWFYFLASHLLALLSSFAIAPWLLSFCTTPLNRQHHINPSTCLPSRNTPSSPPRSSLLSAPPPPHPLPNPLSLKPASGGAGAITTTAMAEMEGTVDREATAEATIPATARAMAVEAALAATVANALQTHLVKTQHQAPAGPATRPPASTSATSPPRASTPARTSTAPAAPVTSLATAMTSASTCRIMSSLSLCPRDRLAIHFARIRSGMAQIFARRFRFCRRLCALHKGSTFLGQCGSFGNAGLVSVKT